MKNRQHHFWTAGLLFGAGVWLTGCACPYRNAPVVCHANEQQGLATIKCQPVDIEHAQGETAVFSVNATGKDLTYQWFFLGEAGIASVVGPGTIGGTTAQLTVSDVESAKSGYYWCEIESSSPLGSPVRTRTRDAHLGIRKDVGGGDGGGIQVYPPQQATAPAPKSGSSTCGTHCSWANYQNGGAGFDPDPGTTKGQVKVRIGTVYRSNTTYHLKWFDNLGNSGCAGNSSSDSQMKEFTINSDRIYFFTVYLMTPCPSQGSQIFFELSFVP